MSTDLVRRQVFALMGRLEDAGAVTSTSLSLASRPDLSFEQFEAIGVFLSRLHDATKWWIGDWVCEGEVRFGDLIYQAAEALGRSERTLANWAWTCRQVPRLRRREGLSFSHHVLVAPLGPEEQVSYLDRAEAEGWSSRQLKAAIEEQRALGSAEDDECADLDDIAADLRDRLRACYGDVKVEITGAGFEYTERIL
jgi:hypothetical protein